MYSSRQMLFQFWDSEILPKEIEPLIETWMNIPGFDYRLFTSQTSEDYIGRYFGARARDAYLQCGAPAMQADFFRYCALYHEGGVYIDADTENGGGLAELITDAARGMVMNRQTKIANDFLYFRAPADPLLREVIDKAISNIEARISNNVWLVTGPGIMTQMYQDIEQRPKFDGLAVCDVKIVREVVHFRNDLDYKTADNDWRRHLHDTSRTIFKDI